jgi:UDP-glucose 4-epimerase
MPRILVVGGAGYIGSHMVKQLRHGSHEVVALDNLSGGFRDSVQGPELVVGSIADAQLLSELFSTRRFDAVMHFASFIEVGESVRDPAKYYASNVAATLTLLHAMLQANVKRFIFSSTAAVFGTPQYVPIDERHMKEPISPYGRSKWMVEQMLEDFDSAYGLKAVCLRYFNAAGADPSALLGERHEPESHLIPLVLQAASKRRKHISVFGNDYATPDGTCIRDYIHVCDLVDAHALALDYLMAGGDSLACNLGNGCGFSVREVIETARKVTGLEIEVVDAPRRPGDPPSLVADSTLARELLGWKPQYPDLKTIIEHAWAWERKWPWA